MQNKNTLLLLGERQAGAAESRGVFEKIPGSGIWWIRYVDYAGRLRREKGGTWATARDLYITRKNEALQGKKLPERLRCRVVRFGELCDDFRKYSEQNNEGFANDCYRI
jgi:hypothetical protein